MKFSDISETDNDKIILRVSRSANETQRLANGEIEVFTMRLRNRQGAKTEVKFALPITLLTFAELSTPTDKEVNFFHNNPHLPRVYWEWQTNHSVSHISNHHLTVRIFVRYVFRGEELAGREL